jgi:hypothetical protein
MKFRGAVSLLFSWSQRPDLNRGPTDYEWKTTLSGNTTASGRRKRLFFGDLHGKGK